MSSLLKSSALIFLVAVTVPAYAQTPTPDTVRSDSIQSIRPIKKVFFPKPTVTAFIPPSILITYGVIALHNPTLQNFDHNVRQTVWVDHPHSRLNIDDYLQFSPAAAVYILNAAGVKGKNNFRDRTILYIMANGFMGVTIEAMKKTISSPRPDGSGNDGFPSGTVGTAFVAAEFLRQEYKDRSPWYGIGGYAAAIATSYLRLYNDRHWFSQLLPAAGIGILSTQSAYWIYPFIQKHIFKTKPANLVAMPFYQTHAAGLSVNYFFH